MCAILTSVFLNTMYSVSDNILLGINYDNVNNIEIVTNGFFGQRNNTIRKNITEKAEIRRYINKLYKTKFYKSSDKQFGQRDFTTMININKNNGNTIKIYIISVQARIYEINSLGEVSISSNLYLISPLVWLNLINVI